MNSYKMIVCDLDRTLLRNDKTISEKSLYMLRQCKERGMHIVLATARPPRSSKCYQLQTSADGLITYNGAFGFASEISFSFPLDRENAGVMLKRLLQQRTGLRISVEIDDTLYANFLMDAAWNDVQLYQDFPKLPEGTLYKVIVGLDDPEVPKLIQDSLPSGMYYSIADGKLVQIMNTQAKKWLAICKLAEIWGVSTEEMICFGDDYDDMEMLKNAGLGVAVRNAIPEVLAIADRITESNEDDGVACFLESIT